MGEPLHTLYVDEIREVSFVAAGDNPPACVLLMKRRPPPSPSTGATMPDATPTAEDIAKRDAEIAEIRKQNAALAATVEKMERDGEIAKIADHYKATGLNADLAPDIYAIRKASPDSAKKIEAELARLSIFAKTAESLTKRAGDAGRVNNGNAELEALIAKHRATGKTQAAATLAAYAERPDLYTDSTTGGN